MDTQQASEKASLRQRAAFILSGLSGGHGIFHWFIQSFWVMLPEVKATLGLSPVQVGSIISVRELSAAAVTLPGGVVIDLFRRYWGLVLAGCMGVFGLGWLIVGLSTLYPLLLIGMSLVAMASSTWHLPAMASLSHRFSRRRGLALSFHGVGGQTGDILGPLVTGFLLGFFAWQGVLRVYALFPIFLTFLVFWAFRDIGNIQSGQVEVDTDRRDLKDQLRATQKLLRTPALWGLSLVMSLWSMGNTAFITFLPIYLREDLSMTTLAAGSYVSLLVFVGVFAAPLLGLLSDKIGRKTVLAPTIISMGVLVLLLVPFGKGIMLAVLIGMMGFFFYSEQPVLMAAALDLFGHRVSTTTLGVLSFARSAVSAISPTIAGILYGNWGITATLYYSAALFLLCALVLLVIPLGKVKPVHEAME